MAIAASSDSKASVSTVNKMITDDNETEIAVEMKSEKPAKKKRNNNPGVRVIRGQIYDSQNGITCHQCRQKTYMAYVACKNLEKTKPCPIKYCRKCLLNRYEEKAEDVELLDQWDCPKCKGVCNCSMCMKKRGQQPTGQLAKMAKAGGFSSVLDLIDAKGVQNVSNYKRAKGTTASPRKLDAAAEEIMITSPKKLGKENLFDGKTDSNADSQLSVPPHAENKPKKMKRKGLEVMQDGTGVSDHVLNEKNQKKVKSKSSKEFVGETTKNEPENEAEENTVVHDQNAAQLLEKPQKIKQKRVKVMQDIVGAGDHAFNEKKQNKTKSKESKEICEEIVSSNTSLKDNSAQQPQNESEEKTTTCDHNATQHSNGNQPSKVKQNAISSFEAVIPLPTGSELVTIAGVDLPKEDAGNALQLLEFCSTFGKILDVKKGQPEAVLRDLINGRSTRRGKYASLIQFHIQLLSVIQEESESESESSLDLTHGNDSWWKALKSCISKSQLKHMDCIETEAGEYDNLDASMKLRLLTFLCDEVLGTEKLRTWMDDKNVKFVEKKKEAKDKLCAAKDKEKSLKQKMLDDVAKAVIANEGVPLTTREYDAIVSKIKNKAAEAHAEMLECKTMVPIGQLLMEKRAHIYWTPCAAHCLDLMLEDIGKIKRVKSTVEKAIYLVGYIYNHPGVLSMMRDFTKNSELARCGVTRFATTFLTFKSLQAHKNDLRSMFADDKWTTSKWCREAKGKRANDIVFTATFWNNISFTIKVMSPIVKVLRLVDNEKKPAMGYIYEAMERAKIAIKNALIQQDDYKTISDIVDKRWNSQLHHPLHAAGYYLNPEFYCYNDEIENDLEVSQGLHDCIKRLVPDKNKQDLIMTEMIQWVNQEGFFRLEVANRAHGRISPDKERPDSVRTEPIFRDNKGHLYWRLKGCFDKPGILLQDLGTGDHAVEVIDNWFEFDDEKTGLLESHINLLRSRFRKCYKI